jgi:enamine deaminase RidA (YjgF/YER057c/UK114 family)
MSSIEKINSPENSQFTHILSHATKVPGLIFLSGATPVGKDGKVVEGNIRVICDFRLHMKLFI